MNVDKKSRRSFLKRSALTTGFATMGSLTYANSNTTTGRQAPKLPREVWIAGISQMGLETETPHLMVEEIMKILQHADGFEPDIVCLPEVFPTSNIRQQMSLEEKLMVSENVLSIFSSYARDKHCYVVCSLYTEENGRAYNSAVVIDREGKQTGEYHKIHLTEGEIANGLTPGPVNPPVFQTDFGTIGIQICFDIEWDDGWRKLREQGAEMVFWPSAFAGGQALNFKAILHKYVVASSTRKNTAKICDITGEEIAKTGIWDRNLYCGAINLEKVFLHTWPYVRRFNDIREKYGRKVRIKTFHEEEWSIIESLAADVKVADLVSEFELETYEKLIKDSEEAQVQARKA